MRFGCCAGIAKASLLKQTGYDFIECTVLSLKPEESESEFKQIFKKHKESPLPVEVFNVLLPGELQITGNHVDQHRIKNYLASALERVKMIGAQIVVFGSGKARSLPAGFSREKGREQILDFLNWTADAADPLDLTIVIEPLNKKESNIINTVPEAADFAKKVNRKSIQVLADFYHMNEENEPLTNIAEFEKYLKHVHVADSGRLAPGTGSYPFEEFVSQMKLANYDSRVSIECSWGDFDKEIKEAYAFLKQQFLA